MSSNSSPPSPISLPSSPKKQKQQLEVQESDYKHEGCDTNLGNTKNLIPKVEEDDSSSDQLIGKTHKEVLPPKYDEETGEELVPYYEYHVPPPKGWTPKPKETLEGSGMFFNRFWLPPEWVVDQFPVEKVVIYKGVFIPHNDQVRQEFLTYLDREYPNARHLLEDYYLQLQHSMVPDFPPDAELPFSVIRPATFFRGSGENLDFYRRVRKNQIKDCLVVALIKLRKITGHSYELVDEDNQPEKANVYCGGSDLYFLRFKAKISSSERVSSFEAIVESCPLDNMTDDEPKDFYSNYDVPPPEGWKPEPEETLEGGMFFNTFWLPPGWVVDQFPVEKVVIYKGVFIPHSDQVRQEFLTYLDREYPNAGKLLEDYYLQLQHSMGFEVPDFPPDTVLPFSVIRPASFFRGSGEDLEFYRRIRSNQIKECLVVALIHLRRITGYTYELEDKDNQPEKANVYCAGSDLYFLRFKAKGKINSSEPERGFDVPVLPSDRLPPFPVIRPVDYFDFDDLSQEDLEFYTRIRHNQIKQCLHVALHHIRELTGDTHELVDKDNQPEKANYYSCGRDLFFLSFKAKNSSSGQVRSFQAVVDSFPADFTAEEPTEFHSALSYIRRLPADYVMMKREIMLHQVS
ncbi:hypothetical protein Tsubulata_006612 [Turnera subulata]|uniref:Uncharacterized protein n=1 Tax=Turnera subulata TaxID=218843 RepID=A0A9Q0FDC7_9ROSI|nr:hypothetical protein Tsubulata_006612 [Turnera subulata]